jgi:HAD superfamily hydrolase (TIGR01458 family)
MKIQYNIKMIKGVIFDIDGVIEFRGHVCPQSVEIINTLRKQGLVLRFLTNSTLKDRVSSATRLQNAGIVLNPTEVITASYATAEYLRSLNPRSCWVLLEREGILEFHDLIHDIENPEYIVIGDYQAKFNFENLNKALRLLLKGSKLVGMISELVDITTGEIELNVGSWVRMLETASGVKATYIGKPNPYMFELTLKSMRLDASEVIMVGDQLGTDILGANQAGIKSILLKTGEYQNRNLDCDARPNFVFSSLEEILSLFPPTA